MSYHELWIILRSWRAEFSTEDFASAFPSPDPRKVLHDMTSKGLLERIGRGRYRVTDLERYLSLKNNVGGAYDILRKAGAPYALTDVDSIFVWTRGGYNANRFFGSYPIYVRVIGSDLERWKKYLALRGKKCMVEGARPKETLYGTYFVLLPTARIDFAVVDGLKVDPLRDAVELCRRDPYTYGPALEMLPGVGYKRRTGSEDEGIQEET